jgi:hypothetical protein
LDAKIHPQLAEDAKFEENRESSSIQPQMQDSGQLEDAGAAKPEGAGTEATRGTISRRRRSEDPG